MQKNMRFAVVAIAVLLCWPGGAVAQLQADGKPGLIINPTRVVLEGRDRSASISIANNGSVSGDYKIELVNKRMNEQGRLVVVEEVKSEDMFADRILRLSPRRVTVEAGDNQNIRILVRKPKNLPDGEYRSHLSVLIIPDEPPLDAQENINDQLVISIKANYGVTIPVIVRSGTLTVTAEISDIKYSPAIEGKSEEENKSAEIAFNITRKGQKSVYGDIKILYINEKGEESVVKFLGGLAIYTPNTVRTFKIPLDIADKVKTGKGILRVIYQEKEKSGGAIIAQHELKM